MTTTAMQTRMTGSHASKKERLEVRGAFPGSRVLRPAKQKYRRWHDSFMMERMIPQGADFTVLRHSAASSASTVRREGGAHLVPNSFPLHLFCWRGLAAWGTTDSQCLRSVPDALTAEFSFPRGEAETGCHDMSLGRSVREAWVGGAAPPCPKPSSATPAIH